VLTHDNLADREDVAERLVFRRVLAKRVKTNTQLMSLPLSLMYFLFYVTAYFMHEDISNVYFLESTIRMRADTLFAQVQTVDELWDQLSGPFVDTFFVQHDTFGNPLPKSLQEEDRWGLWGRVETYSQIQGAMRLSTSRRSQSPYGVSPWTCDSSVTCDLCRSNAGFQPRGEAVRHDHDCGNWTRAANAGASAPNASASNASRSSARRLELYSPELDGIMQGASVGMGERFVVYLYPSSERSVIEETLEYYRSRGWLDHLTDYLEIQFYIANCELGRCRLEQVKLMLWFSQGGGIYFKKLVFPIFLELFSGPLNMLVDGAFFTVWLITSLFRFSLAWRAFVHEELPLHLKDPLNLFELCVVLAGFGVCAVVGAFYFIARTCKDVLRPIRDLGWSINSSHEDLVEDLFVTITPWADTLENVRMIGNFFAIVLMYRFFINFGAQPRLRVVTRTLAVVINDLFHFGLVFIPVLLAYMVSGTIMFGRSFLSFATVKAALGTSFRIMMEGEYDWAGWTQDYYWYTGLWAWSFMFMVVLLMLNMVLAIILDVYNDVRASLGAADAEPIWTTLYQVGMRCIHARRWVSERNLLKACQTSELLQQPVISAEAIQAIFPTIPDVELSILFRECRQAMRQVSAKHLSNQNLLVAAGSMLNSIDKKLMDMRRLTVKEGRDPLRAWVTPVIHRTGDSLKGATGRDTFLTSWAESKGSSAPSIADPSEEGLSSEATSSTCSSWRRGLYRVRQPPWLKEVNKMLAWQRKWLQHMEWELRQLEWHIQLGHVTEYEKLLASGGKPRAL